MSLPLKGTTKFPLVSVTLVLVVAAGAALRLKNIGAESLWLDEAYSISIAHQSLDGIVHDISKDVHPPLYYFALHYWIELFGEREGSARMLSAFFGILAIPLIYKLSALLFDRATGVFSAVILAWSHFNIEFSQEARMYSLLALLTLASLYFFIKLLMTDARPLALFGYIACSSLLTYTQVYAFFVIIAENLFVLSLCVSSRGLFRRVLKRWMVAQAVLLLLFAPWLIVLARQISEHKGFWIPKPTLFEFRYTWLQFAGSWPLLLILLPLAALPFVSLLKTGKIRFMISASETNAADLPLSGRERVWLVILWLACPVLLPFVASCFITPFYLYKYTISASLAFVLLAARGLRILRSRQLGVALLAIVLVFAQRDILNYWHAVKKDNWRAALVFFNQAAQPNDLVLFTEPAAHVPFDYYSTRRDVIEEPFPDYKDRLTAANLPQLLKQATENHQRVWIVLSHQNELSPMVPKQMSEWYDVLGRHRELGVELYLFVKQK